jgi:DNA-binding transcriptional MerR regulator
MKSTPKSKLRIGDVAKQLDVKEFVIRFWEREFKIKAKRSAGGQRFYTKKHLDLLSTIRDLLYKHGYTISGAKKHLEGQRAPGQAQHDNLTSKMLVTAAKRDVATEETTDTRPESFFTQQLQNIKEQLIKLKQIL